MIDKVKKNLTTGITRVKWMASFVAERTKAETSAAKLLYESSKLENKMDELYREVGKRVSELKGKSEKGERDVFKDFIVEEALDEIKRLRETIDNYKSKARNIDKLPE